MPFNHDDIDLYYKKYVITPGTPIVIPNDETVANVVLDSDNAVVVITVKAADKV